MLHSGVLLLGFVLHHFQWGLACASRAWTGPGAWDVAMASAPGSPALGYNPDCNACTSRVCRMPWSFHGDGQGSVLPLFPFRNRTYDSRAKCHIFVPSRACWFPAGSSHVAAAWAAPHSHSAWEELRPLLGSAVPTPGSLPTFWGAGSGGGLGPERTLSPPGRKEGRGKNNPWVGSGPCGFLQFTALPGEGEAGTCLDLSSL